MTEGELITANSDSRILTAEGIATNGFHPVDLYLGTLAESGRRSMGSALKSIAEMLGFADAKEMPWNELSRDHVIAIMVKLEGRNLSPDTRRTYLTALKGVAREAWHKKIIDADVYAGIKDVKGAKGKRDLKGRRLEMEEVYAMLDVCMNDPRPQGLRDSAMISLLMVGGFRRTELVSINLEDANLQTKEIHIIGKGDKERNASIDTKSGGAVEALKLWINEHRGEEPGPLFTRIRRYGDVTMDRLTDNAVYYILEQCYIKAGLGSVRPHDMRRTLINTLLDQGVDIGTVADVVGHSNPSTTKRYDRDGEKRARKAVKGLDF